MSLLKLRIQEMGLSQTQLADLAGVSQPWLNKVINGKKTNLTIGKICSLAEALNIAPVELFEDLLLFKS